MTNKLLEEVVTSITEQLIVTFNRGTVIYDEIFSHLLRKGDKLVKSYKPMKNGLSLKNFLYERLPLEYSDLNRRFNAHKRNIARPLEESDCRKLHSRDEWEQRYANEDLVVAVRQVVASLTKDESLLAECLVEDDVVAHAESKLGWTHGKTTRTLEKLRDKFRKFANYRTFSRCKTKYTFEATC